MNEKEKKGEEKEQINNKVMFKMISKIILLILIGIGTVVRIALLLGLVLSFFI